MKKIFYFLEFITIKILFIFFQIIGYRLSSNLGFFIGEMLLIKNPTDYTKVVAEGGKEFLIEIK